MRTEPAPNEVAFMAGVALFDDLLRESDLLCEGQMAPLGSDARRACDACWLEGRHRDNTPLTLYALPFLETLMSKPELARGFAGALGSYVAMVHHDLAPKGAQYEGLTFEDCMRVAPFEDEVEDLKSNVVPLVRAGR